MKTRIKNQLGQKLAIVVETSTPQKGLAFVMHGLGGFKEQPHIQVLAETLREKGYTVVTFDTTNSFGESDGDYSDATTTNYEADLEAVIDWAKDQSWYTEPFILAGHSLGGFCTLIYSEQHPEKVKAIAPLGTVVSGKLSLEYRTRLYPNEIKEWQESGWKITPSNSKDGITKKLRWAEMEDRLKYNVLNEVGTLKMPVLLVVGSKDTHCPPEQQKLLYEKLPGKKQLHIIDGMEHTPRYPEHLSKLKEIFAKWLGSLF